MARAIAAPANELEESRRWVHANPELRRELESAAEERFADFPDTAAMRRQRERWLDNQGIDRWRAAGSPILTATHPGAPVHERSPPGAGS